MLRLHCAQPSTSAQPVLRATSGEVNVANTHMWKPRGHHRDDTERRVCTQCHSEKAAEPREGPSSFQITPWQGLCLFGVTPQHLAGKAECGSLKWLPEMSQGKHCWSHQRDTAGALPPRPGSYRGLIRPYNTRRGGSAEAMGAWQQLHVANQQGVRVESEMGKEVGVGEDSLNRKCTWNMPCSRLRPGCRPQTSTFSVLPQMLKICLPPQGRPAHSSSSGRVSLRQLWGTRLQSTHTHTEAPQLWKVCRKTPSWGLRAGHGRGPNLRHDTPETERDRWAVVTSRVTHPELISPEPPWRGQAWGAGGG